MFFIIKTHHKTDSRVSIGSPFSAVFFFGWAERQQSRETTLEEAKRIFGPELQHLYQAEVYDEFRWAMKKIPWLIWDNMG